MVKIKMPNSKPRISGLDTIRFFAATSVMMAHLVGPHLPGLFQRYSWLSGAAPYARYIFTGGPAVMVFFVLSGFCIHYPYVEKPLPTIAFISARWIRILTPMIFAYLLAQLVNITQYNVVDGYILWSVICEAVYYTFYPFLILAAKKFHWITIFALSLFVSITWIIVAGSDKYGNLHVYGIFGNWIVLMPAWLLGVLLAEHVVKKPSSKEVKYWKLMIQRMCIAGLASVLQFLTLNTPLGLHLTFIPFAILVTLWLRSEILYYSKHAGNKVFEWLGKFSYSIYLTHVIWAAVLVLAKENIKTGIFVNLILVLIFCYLFYLLIEKPAHLIARKIYGHMIA